MDPSQRFHRHFQASATTIQEQIAHLPNISSVGGERQDAIDHVLSGISRLSYEVADAADYVPAYDRRMYDKALKALQEQLDETKAKFAPKSRFQFKPRTGQATAGGVDPRRFVPAGSSSPASVDTASTSTTTPQTTPSLDSSEQRDGPALPPTITTTPAAPAKNYNEEIARPGLKIQGEVRRPSFSSARDINISGHRGLHILLPSSASRATSSGVLMDLTGCIVDMSIPTLPRNAPFASLALRDIDRCLIVAGHVNGSVHLTNLKDCVLVVVARQVRIHECENVDLYLHCASRPIVEFCKGMRFAPAPASFTTKEDEQSTNQWDQVDDFKWLKADHSPNWSILPKEDRVPDQVWRDTVIGGSGFVGVNDILTKVGIRSK
ncbi:tubulin binding cofactor C-domain-containing protein [Podospora appendiculata]|uniref:Tubulin binding cofactor C-domain-containing protein n=1 Tax=Podospora appendiculata TaxID=314037 RepID=A0AAE0XBX1_9PEZI|nr:tubulin binding cofactor C-domain-containing protein [Podospora appendiculata]